MADDLDSFFTAQIRRIRATRTTIRTVPKGRATSEKALEHFYGCTTLIRPDTISLVGGGDEVDIVFKK